MNIILYATPYEAFCPLIYIQFVLDTDTNNRQIDNPISFKTYANPSFFNLIEIKGISRKDLARWDGKKRKF